MSDQYINPTIGKKLDHLYSYWLQYNMNSYLTTSKTIKMWFMSGKNLDNELSFHYKDLFNFVFNYLQKYRISSLLQNYASNYDIYGNWLNFNIGRVIAIIILLDQIPRNIYRGTSMAYSGDYYSLQIVYTLERYGYDLMIFTPVFLHILTLPMIHSELLCDVKRAVEIWKKYALNSEFAKLDGFDNFYKKVMKNYEQHLDIIVKFGRYPKRNEFLGRLSTRAEHEYLMENPQGHV